MNTKYPKVFNRGNPVLLDNSVALGLYKKCEIHPFIIIKWLTDYVNKSNYFALVKLNAPMYNLDMEVTGHVTEDDITQVEELQKLFGQHFADPTYDYTFKMLFANESHKDLLISFLNACIHFPDEKQITEVRILNNDHIPAGIYGIRSAVDILCTNSNGEKIVVEMQREFKHISYQEHSIICLG